jgi:hypothetical protein
MRRDIRVRRKETPNICVSASNSTSRGDDVVSYAPISRDAGRDETCFRRGPPARRVLPTTHARQRSHIGEARPETAYSRRQAWSLVWSGRCSPVTSVVCFSPSRQRTDPLTEHSRAKPAPPPTTPTPRMTLVAQPPHSAPAMCPARLPTLLALTATRSPATAATQKQTLACIASRRGWRRRRYQRSIAGTTVREAYMASGWSVSGSVL